MKTMAFNEAIRSALHEEMERDESVFVIGEDVSEPTITFDCRRYRINPLLLVADVKKNIERISSLLPNLTCHLATELFIDVRNHDSFCTFLREQSTGRCSDS